MSDDNDNENTLGFDDSPEPSPLLIRTPNSGDAAAVDRQTGEKLAKLTREEQANLTIPTRAEVGRMGRLGDFQEGLEGTPQQQIELSRLSNELSVLKMRVVKARAASSTGYVDPMLEQEIVAKENSLNYQADAIRRMTPDPLTAQLESDQEQLLSLYKTDMTFAVNTMMREERLDKATAIGLVDKKIAALGVAAVLPQYARVQARMTHNYQQADDNDNA